MSDPRRTMLRDLLLGGLVVLLVASPALFTDRGYGVDTTNNIWLIWQQGLAIAHSGHPTLFLSSTAQHVAPVGVFEPLFAFYGGTLFACFGALSALLGHRPAVAWALSIIVLTAMAYRGIWLIARQAGAGRLESHLPAFVFVTSAYFLTDAYARGAWTELGALGALPFALGYGLRLLREPWTARGVAAYLAGVALFSGSHNISLLWGTLIVGIVGALMLLVAGAGRPPLRTLAAVAALTLLGVAVNAWFLVVDLLHGGDVVASELQPMAWETTRDWDTIGAALNPLRVTPAVSTTFGLTIAAPVLALALALLVRGRARRATGAPAQPLGRLWWVLLAGTAGVVALLLMPQAGWDALPRTLTFIQFPFRLAGWIALGFALLLAVSLGLAGRGGERRPVWLGGLMVGLVAITVVQTVAQLYATTDDEKSTRSRASSLAAGPDVPPTSWYDFGFYRDATLPQVLPRSDYAIGFPAPAHGATTTTTTVDLSVGIEPVQTNLSGGPWSLRLDLPPGVTVAGRHVKDNTLALSTAAATPGKVTITATADAGTPARLGAIVSILALLASAGLVAGVAVWGRRPVTA